MPRLDGILQRLGDWLFSLRAGIDRLRHRRADGPGIGGAAAQAAREVQAFDWSTFKSPRKLRKFLQENQIVFIGLACCIMLASFYIIFRQVQPPPTSRASNDTEYFYDLTTGSVFVRLINGQTVADSPSGGQLADGAPAGVKAHVFSCGDCESESGMFIGYLMVSADERQIPTSQPANTEADDPDAPRKATEYMLVAAPPSATVRFHSGITTASQPAPLKWIPAHTPEAAAILEAPQKRCGGSLTNCAPLE